MEVKNVLAGAIRLLCGARLHVAAPLPAGRCIYFSNHSSHLDFAMIWACLPRASRETVRPVAGRDYWEKTRFRRWLARRVFNAVLIERQRVTVSNNPLTPMIAALDEGSSLIVFPEGTRSPDGQLKAFKPGLYHLAKARPEVPLVPVFLDNLNRVLPKGELLPLPLISSAFADEALFLLPDETREQFLARTHQAIEQLAQPSSP